MSQGIASGLKETMVSILQGDDVFKNVPACVELKCVLCGKPESRLIILSGTRNSRGLTGKVGHSRAARCLRIKEFSFFIRGIHLVL